MSVPDPPRSDTTASSVAPPPFVVESVTLRELGLRLVEPFVTSFGETLERRVLLVEVAGSAADGSATAVGWGECVAMERPSYSPETVDTAWMMLEGLLAPRLVGRRIEHPAHVWSLLELGVRGHRMARASLEMACWELAARLADEPLARLLGGTREHLDVGLSIGIQETPSLLADKARAAVERGYRKVKVKIRPGADLEHVAPLRDLLPDAPLAVDANAAYRSEDFDHLARLDDLDLLMIEQPLGPEDLLRHARLQARLETPLCLDESITGVERAEDMLELDAGRIVNIKPGRVGGFTPSLAIHALCREAGVPVWCGGMLESGVGRGHNVALASLPGFTLPGDLSPSERYWTRDVVEPAWTMDGDGRVAVPWDRPGLGAEVDGDFVESITARRRRIDVGGGGDGPGDAP